MVSDKRAGVDLATLAVPFERLAASRRDGRAVAPADDAHWKAFPSAAIAFREVFVEFARSPAWHAICLPPGLPLERHPAADWLEPAGEAVSGQWVFFVVDRDGRRAAPVPVLPASGLVDPASWRAAAACRAAAWLTGADSPPELDRAEHGLRTGNAVLIADYAVRRDGATPEQAAFFGAVWDLMRLVCAEVAPPVSPGSWRLPGSAQHFLRVRMGVLAELAIAFVAPDRFRPEALRLALAGWFGQTRLSAARRRGLELFEVLRLARPGAAREEPPEGVPAHLLARRLHLLGALTGLKLRRAADSFGLSKREAKKLLGRFGLRYSRRDRVARERVRVAIEGGLLDPICGRA